MGNFIVTTAFNTNDTFNVSKAIIEYCAKHDLGASILPSKNESSTNRLGTLYTSKNDWCVVIWPTYFGHDIPLVEALSDELNLAASTVYVHDSDFWCHRFFNGGNLLDEYCSVPNFYDDSVVYSEKEISEFKTSAEVVSNILGVVKERIEGYFQPILEDRDYGKVHQNDEYELDNFWVFTDLWNKLGIEYPGGSTAVDAVLDLTEYYDSKLPENFA